MPVVRTCSAYAPAASGVVFAVGTTFAPSQHRDTERSGARQPDHGVGQVSGSELRSQPGIQEHVGHRIGVEPFEDQLGVGDPEHTGTLARAVHRFPLGVVGDTRL